jgi:hypothetical protein
MIPPGSVTGERNRRRARLSPTLHHLVLVVSRPQGRETGQGVEDAGESEGRPVIGWIGRCPSRKGAHFRRVSPKAMPLPCGTCRDVRR